MSWLRPVEGMNSMTFIEQLRQHSQETGSGLQPARIRDFELRLGVHLPAEYRQFLVELNYAELFSDPIYGLHNDMETIDLYATNRHEEHFRFGFLQFFASDIDGAVFMRPDSGLIYLGDFKSPVAGGFGEFVCRVLSE